MPAAIGNHQWKGSNIVVAASHFTCQFGCAAQNTWPESDLPNTFSPKGHQRVPPLAVSNSYPITETFAKGAASSLRWAMVLNRLNQERLQGRSAVGLSLRTLACRALPTHVEPCERKGIAQIQSVGACWNRRSRATFSRHALICAWSFP